MTMLLKYELLRRKRLLIGAALTMVILEALILLGLWRGGNWTILSVILLVALVVGGMLLPLLDAVTQYYSDFKRRHGFMLFMTPRSGYAILWAKALFALAELVAAVALVAGCVGLTAVAADRFNDGVLSSVYAEIQNQWRLMSGTELPVGRIIAVYGGVATLQVFTNIAIALLALTFCRIMLPGKSFNWLVALVMYFAVALVVEFADAGFMLAFGAIGDARQLAAASAEMGRYLLKYAALGTGMYAFWSVACVTLSGLLVNRGVDL